jgi:hypothetical protein
MAKRGTEENPIRLRSIDGAQAMTEDTYVVLSSRQICQLQRREPFDPRPSNHRELHSNDIEVPPIPPDYRGIDRLAFGNEDVPRTVINGKRDISGGVILSDKEKLVMLATNCLTPEMKRPHIAEAMKMTFNEVRSLRWRAEKAMQSHFKLAKTAVEDRQDLRQLREIQKLDNHPTIIAKNDEDVVITVKVLRILQGGDCTKPKMTASDLFPKKKEWNQKTSVVPPSASDYRELHRLLYGTDPVDDESFQTLKRYLGGRVCLTDKQRLVTLPLVALTKPLGMYAIARAMGINKNHVILLRRQTLEIMKEAPPALLADERVRKAKAMRPLSPLD